jgi:hypothetical protein
MELIGFTWVLGENSANTQVNDTNDFEASKLGGTIDWELVFKYLKNLKFF